ncbi:MAG TPA: PA2779 family protein [Gammaproteobacteria bacterium]|nr:PA2779 family protein [Gammaproteobacteria bacterium]
MNFFRLHAKLACHIAAACMLFVSAYAPAAHAGIVGTEALLNAEQSRATVNAFLAREDVRGQLAMLGVDPAQASLRTDALTDSEVQALADRIDNLPAGGDLIGAAVFVFLVLLVTDLLGLTDVFPFVKKK